MRHLPKDQINSSRSSSTPADSPNSPTQLITSDIVGPLPTTTSSNNYIIVICDHFTKFVYCLAAPDQTAKSVAKCIASFMFIFGITDSILTDQGTNYQSEMLAELYDLLDIKKLRTTPFHPQCDGITERFNRTLKQMIRAYVDTSQTNWIQLLPELCFAYNTAVHKTTDHTPSELMLGRRVKLPVITSSFQNSINAFWLKRLLQTVTHSNSNQIWRKSLRLYRIIATAIWTKPRFAMTGLFVQLPSKSETKFFC